MSWPFRLQRLRVLLGYLVEQEQIITSTKISVQTFCRYPTITVLSHLPNPGTVLGNEVWLKALFEARWRRCLFDGLILVPAKAKVN